MAHAHSASDRLDGKRSQSNSREERGDHPHDERDLIGYAQRLSHEGDEDAKHQESDRCDEIRCARSVSSWCCRSSASASCWCYLASASA